MAQRSNVHDVNLVVLKTVGKHTENNFIKFPNELFLVVRLVLIIPN